MGARCVFATAHQQSSTGERVAQVSRVLLVPFYLILYILWRYSLLVVPPRVSRSRKFFSWKAFCTSSDFFVCLFVLFFLLLCSMRGVSSIQGLSGHFCPLNSLFWMGVRALTVHTIPSALCVINCSFWGLCSFSCQWQHWCVLWGMTTCSLCTRAVLPKTSSCLGLWGTILQGWWLQSEGRVGGAGWGQRFCCCDPFLLWSP